MNALAWIGEVRIAQAVQDGKLDNLPGTGRPLDLTLRDGALEAQARLGLELLERARRAPADTAQDQRERAALRLLWARALARQRRDRNTP
ncbi:MAG: DnaJ family domain-containing protein [Thiomonas sp.]